MNQGEFYGSNEYNPISEYKHFPAEMYIKPNEENLSGNELADLGREITTLQSKSKIAKKSGALGKPFEYIFNSLRGVATLATAAASLLIMTTALVTGTPDAELVKVECGDTYIEYEMEVSGLDADGEYAIVLSTTDEEDVEIELDGDGTYSDRIDGLKSEWEYKLALVQYDSVLGEIYHFEVKLQTLKHRDQDPIPPTEDEPESHIHNFVEGVCECGEVDPNYVPPHTHNFVESVCECGEVDPNYVPPHTHNFVEGVCDCGEVDPNYVPPHTHNFVEGVCECGEVDPNYVPPHTHNFVEGVCDCGERDPNYVPPHTHNFVEGVCECGERDPNYVPPHTHNFVEGVCDCGERDPNYVPPHTHNFVEGVCECGEVDPNYVPPHTHNFVEGVCDCGEVDPNYVPPHTHNFVEGVCECGEVDPNYVPPHTHNFVEGVCECGEVDPNYVPPHTHNFVEGVCECGEVDPNYVPPHTHNFVEGVCDCGEIDPNYVPPHTHNFVEGVCDCGEVDPNYVPPHTHNFVEGVCDCGERDPNYVPDPIPNITVSGAEIVGLNKINVYFTHSDISDGDIAELEILADDFGGFRMPIYDEDLERGYITIDTEDMQISNTLTIKPYVTEIQDNERVVVECEEYSHIFEETFSVEVMVGLKNEMITFYPSGLANGADSIHITSSLNPEEPTVEWLDDVVRIWYDSYDVITYTMYLTNENGDILSNEVEITVNTSVSVPDYEYNIHSVNPGEVGITYNDDGTINMYIQNNFVANSEDVYYQITVGNIRYKSREPLAKLEGIADESYALSYDVCVDIDGVQYSIFNTVPSGVANESYIYYESEFSNNVLMLSLYKDSTGLDLNSVRLVSSAGEEILLSESDFVYNEEYNSYDISVTLNEYAESVEIYMMANPYIGGLADVSDYIGNERKIFVETVYQP